MVLNEAAQAGLSCPGSEILLVPIAVITVSQPLLFPCAQGHGFLSWDQRTIAVTQTVSSGLQSVELIKDVPLWRLEHCRPSSSTAVLHSLVVSAHPVALWFSPVVMVSFWFKF